MVKKGRGKSRVMKEEEGEEVEDDDDDDDKLGEPSKRRYQYTCIDRFPLSIQHLTLKQEELLFSI